MVAFDTEENFVNGIISVANDGGQQFPDYHQEPKGLEPKNLKEAQSPKYKIDGIINTNIGDGYAWVRGDATRAYSPTKIKKYIRDVLMVNTPSGRNHPYILLFDRIETAKPLKPNILFHVNEEPLVEKLYFGVKNSGGGFLHGETFATQKLKTRLVGGNKKRWWVNGRNYPVRKLDMEVDPGWGRIEIGSLEKTNKLEMITLLSVDNTENFQGKPALQMVTGEGFYGIMDHKNLYIINFLERPSLQWTFSGKQFDNIEQMIITGIVPNKEYSIMINETEKNLRPQENTIFFERTINPHIPQPMIERNQ